MLFKRRHTEPFWNKIRNLLWPRMGLQRMVDYYKHRTIRIPASDYAIASGVAFGALVSWTPTFPTHLVQCLLFCWIFRANFLAAFVGSAFGNLWTTPFLLYAAYLAGKVMLTMLGFDHLVMNYNGPLTLEVIKQEGMRIFLPTLIGGYTLGIVTFPLFYYPTYYMVKAARAARQKRIAKKMAKEQGNPS
jgi:uncharacterized protein